MENEDNLDLGQDTLQESEEQETPQEEKRPLTEEQILGIKKRQFSKLAKELGVDLPKEKPEPKPAEKIEGFGDAQYAFMTSQGIPEEDWDFVEQTSKETGKRLRDLLGTKWFKAELKERTDTRKNQMATPPSAKRAGAPASDDVSYHVSKYKEGLSTGKGEILPEDKTMRRKVVEALRKEGKESGSNFAPVSIING